MTEQRTIAVIGATGTQGGGLADGILSNQAGPFRLRALTRNPDSDAARGLAERGAEVVATDMDDEESLKRAFDGAHGVFAVTNFWEHFSPDTEIQQARNVAGAARDAGVSHVVWSTLEDMREKVPTSDDRMPTLMEKYTVPHYDGKGEADAEFREAGVPTTFFRTSFYWDNMIHFGMGPRPGDDGKLRLTLPVGDARLPGMAAEDIGKCALGVFRRGGEFNGRTIGVAGEFLSGQEMANGLTEALGREVLYNEVSPETYRSFGFDGADDLGNMFQVKRDFADWYCGNRDLELSRRLNPELMTYKDWLSNYAHQIPVD
jgi:uncharacterized protein YbjT (DUF2867 family)